MKVTHRDALVIQLALITQALNITMGKRADYSSIDDPYENFREGNDMSGIEHAWQYAVRRNMEKFTRRKNIMKSGHGRAWAQDDSFVDAAVDSINLTHIEFALQLEEIESGPEILKGMDEQIRALPDLVDAFMARIRKLESEAAAALIEAKMSLHPDQDGD